MSDLRAFLVRATLDGEFRELVTTDLDRALDGFELEPSEREALRAGGPHVLSLIGKVLAPETELREARPLPEVAPSAAQTPEELPDLQLSVTLTPTRVGETVSYRAQVGPGAVPGEPVAGTDPQWGHRLGSRAAHAAARAVLEAEPAGRREALADLLRALRDPEAPEELEPPLPPEAPPAVHVVGLGVKNFDHLTVEADRVLRRARRVLYLDTGLATRELLEERCDRVEALYSDVYAEHESRIEAYVRVATRVLEAALEEAPVVFAIQGHPTVFCYPPLLVRDAARLLEMRVEILPGISALDALQAELGFDPAVHGAQLFEVTDLLLRRRPLAPDVPAFLWQVGSAETRLHTRRLSAPGRLDRLLAWLLRFYPADHTVYALFSSPHPLAPSMHFSFPLRELSQHATALHQGVTLYLPRAWTRPVADADLLAKLDSPEHLAGLSLG